MSEFDVKDLGLSAITDVMSIKPVKFVGIGNYTFFKCRSIVRDEKQTGEYHIKPNGVKIMDLIAVLNGKLEGIEDMQNVPDFVDYPIYMKIGSFMTNENIDELLKDVDNYFKGGQG